MRLRVKMVLFCLVTVIMFLLLYPHAFSISNFASFHQLLLETDTSWMSSSFKHSPTVKTLTLQSLQKFQEAPSRMTLTKLVLLQNEDHLPTVNASIMSMPAGRKAIELVKGTMMLQRQIEAAATPKDFIDIPKNGVLQTKKRELWKVSTDVIATSKSRYTPAMLRHRAKTFAQGTPVARFLSEQRRRFGHIRRQCVLSHKGLPDGTRPAGLDMSALEIQAYSYLLLDGQNHLTLCPVYKAASTSWSITLLQLRGLWRSGRRKPALQALLRQVFPRLSGIGGPSLIRNTIKFMVVRHPFERLVSCFRDKYEHASKSYYYKLYGESMVRMFRPKPEGFTSHEVSIMLREVREGVSNEQLLHLRGNPYADPVGPTFPEFVEFITTSHRDDEHWRPYHQHCASCDIDYDIVLKFENLYDEGAQFIEYLNRTAELEPRWDNLSITGSSTVEVACSYFGQLTVGLVTRLKHKYAKDFLLYEYSADKYYKCAKDYYTREGVTTAKKSRKNDKPNPLLVDDFR